MKTVREYLETIIKVDPVANCVLIYSEPPAPPLELKTVAKAHVAAEWMVEKLEKAFEAYISALERSTPSSPPPAHPHPEKTLTSHVIAPPQPSAAVSGGVEAVLEERGRTYGPNPFNQETVARGWEAILMSAWQQPLPGPIQPHIVALMMCTLKILRWSCPFEYNPDNKIDLEGYSAIAERCDSRVRHPLQKGA